MSSADRIVAWLRAAGGALSGEEMARRLGCSRAAVGKHVAALRRGGYGIDARPSQGYVLVHTPDRLSPAELAPHWRGGWRTVEWHAEIDSTQRRARELAAAGASEGTTVVAETQTAGRGRLGRGWHSPPGVNVYVSVVLRPPVPPLVVPQLALVAGLAVADAVRAVTGLAPRIKWPNDVLVDGRKVAGILLEMDAELEQVRHVIAGIGVNVNLTGFPPDLRAKAGSLRLALGRPVDRAAFAARLLADLEARYSRFVSSGLAAMLSEWEAFSALTGRTVRVAGPEGEVEGRVLGLADDGALRLDTAAGPARVVAGEVTVQDGYGG